MRYIITFLSAYLLLSLSATAQVRTPNAVPDRLLYFQCSYENSKMVLSWGITNNNVYNYFEVQRSTDGKEFKTAAIVFASEKPEIENYIFKTTATDSITYYRLKLITIHGQFSYSRIIVAKTKNTSAVFNNILFLQNPVKDNIIFRYHAPVRGDYDIAVYTASGIKIHGMRKACSKGVNMMVLPTGLAPNSHYILEIKNGSSRSTASFIKQ